MRKPSRAILVLAVLAGCTASPDEPDAAPRAAAEEPTVAWLEGDPDAAFALAREEGRPVFLYWGAEWCPPCHYLKEKIFHTPEFVERSESFVMVYLDGDTESAQILGEQLGVRGYPTVIVFSPQGDELLRMSSEAAPETYAALMERAARLDRPVEAILEEVLADGPDAADPGDLDVLAHHSWSQDERVASDDGERLEAFGRLWRETPEERVVLRSRFLWLYLDELASVEEAPEPGADERRRLLADLREALAAPEARRANLYGLAFGAPELIELLTEDGSPERTDLAAAWRDAAIACEADELLTVDDRLTCVLPRIEIARWQAGEDDPLPDALSQHVRDRVAWAGEAVREEGELQAVMSTMVSLLEEAGLEEEAEALIAERLADTHAPYYFMSWLASLHEDAGRDAEALEWYRRAYDGSRGRYSRFRWGSLYLRNLLELAPEDSGRIAADGTEILDELLALDDAFAGGNYLRLGQLGRALETWEEEGGDPAVVARLRDRVHAACHAFPAEGGDSQRARCEGFLADAA